LGKVTKPCGAWWRIKKARRRSYDMSGKNLDRNLIELDGGSKKHVEDHMT
jgi:hypothetical protein